jgi:hypothetical protein
LLHWTPLAPVPSPTSNAITLATAPATASVASTPNSINAIALPTWTGERKCKGPALISIQVKYGNEAPPPEDTFEIDIHSGDSMSEDELYHTDPEIFLLDDSDTMKGKAIAKPKSKGKGKGSHATGPDSLDNNWENIKDDNHVMNSKPRGPYE